MPPSRRTSAKRLRLDEFATTFELDLANLALIEDGGAVRVLLGRPRAGGRITGLLGQRIALDRETSGINAAVRAREQRSRSTTPSSRAGRQLSG